MNGMVLVGTTKAMNVTNLSGYKTLFGGNTVCKPEGEKYANNLESITCTVGNAIKLIFDIAGVLAFIMILYASIIYLTSYGEESRVEMAKKTLIWSVVGVIVIILAKSVLLIIANAVTNGTPTKPL